MLTDFGLAHPSINPTRPKQIKSLPDNKSGTSTSKQRSSSCDLNVRYLLMVKKKFKFNNLTIFKLIQTDHKRSSSVTPIRLSSCQKRILQNIADGTNSVPHGCSLRKRTKLMMPKVPLLKENSPIKKQFDVPKNNNPSNSSASNNLLNVSLNDSMWYVYFLVVFICFVFVNRRKTALLFQKCHV